MRALLVGLLLLLVGVGASRAHEVRPALLEIDQTGPGAYSVLWKQPVMGELAVHLAPQLSNGWLSQRPVEQFADAGFLVRRWSIRDGAPRPLEGRTLTIDGLADTITDVFVRIRTLNRPETDIVLRPEAPSTLLSFAQPASLSAAAFLGLGVSHILTGPDHLLFVFGLLLIAGDRWALLKTVSAFTLAHSLTLAAATLGLVRVSPALTNALIALSILFLAPEILRAERGGSSLTLRRPWLVAFAFGLLHGLGFANGLVTLGMSRGALAEALVLFNIGVECGQLSFIGLVWALARGLRLMDLHWTGPVRAAPAYLIGALGAFWTLQYAALALAAP